MRFLFCETFSYVGKLYLPMGIASIKSFIHYINNPIEFLTLQDLKHDQIKYYMIKEIKEM